MRKDLYVSENISKPARENDLNYESLEKLAFSEQLTHLHHANVTTRKKEKKQNNGTIPHRKFHIQLVDHQ